MPQLKLAAASYLVRTTQPLSVLAALLLEPQSDDGLATWNFFDAELTPRMADADAAKHIFPVSRLTTALTAPTRIIP